jgi:hypothetical protein
MSNINRIIHCSYCREAHHNIKNCNNINLLKFKKFILIQRNHYIGEPSLFLNTIKYLDPNDLWGLAVKECGILVRNTNKNQCINAIFDKFFIHNSNDVHMIENEIYILNQQIGEIEQNNENQEIEQNNENQNENYDSDPDLISVSSYSDTEDELEITWVIDRTGTRTERKIFEISRELEINESDKLDIIECGICYDSYNKDNFIQLQCNHEFCNNCIIKQLKCNKPSCAFCREEMKHFTIRNMDINEKINNNLLVYM